MRVLALHRITEVTFDPFKADLVVVDAAGIGVLGGAEVLDKKVGLVGE